MGLKIHKCLQCVLGGVINVSIAYILCQCITIFTLFLVYKGGGGGGGGGAMYMYDGAWQEEGGFEMIINPDCCE